MVERWNRFRLNVGAFGIVRLVVVLLAIAVLVIGGSIQGWAIVLLLGITGALVVGYLLQNILADNVQITRKIMNVFATAILFSLLLPAEVKESDWVLIGAPILVTFYLSCYFWFMSHPDIIVQR
jgi:hypothetical protein